MRVIGIMNGYSVSGHYDPETNEFSLYRAVGNTDVYEVIKVDSPARVTVGKYIRTDYKS